ncbi:hypothetical protein VP01_1460g4 [Puccinia sorghi]|uniref:Uncharacterized protein n=1 Tax=Puccinia sorghi TaxID=27349 RepID=A0A0L6VJS7_9BASI|nr:hypothetical protein VP01_1460g4 [Puccinia sorghi]
MDLTIELLTLETVITEIIMIKFVTRNTHLCTITWFRNPPGPVRRRPVGRRSKVGGSCVKPPLGIRPATPIGVLKIGSTNLDQLRNVLPFLFIQKYRGGKNTTESSSLATHDTWMNVGQAIDFVFKNHSHKIFFCVKEGSQNITVRVIDFSNPGSILVAYFLGLVCFCVLNQCEEKPHIEGTSREQGWQQYFFHGGVWWHWMEKDETKDRKHLVGNSYVQDSMIGRDCSFEGRFWSRVYMHICREILAVDSDKEAYSHANIWDERWSMRGYSNEIGVLGNRDFFQKQKTKNKKKDRAVVNIRWKRRIRRPLVQERLQWRRHDCRRKVRRGVGDWMRRKSGSPGMAPVTQLYCHLTSCHIFRFIFGSRCACRTFGSSLISRVAPLFRRLLSGFSISWCISNASKEKKGRAIAGFSWRTLTKCATCFLEDGFVIFLVVHFFESKKEYSVELGIRSDCGLVLAWCEVESKGGVEGVCVVKISEELRLYALWSSGDSRKRAEHEEEDRRDCRTQDSQAGYKDMLVWYSGSGRNRRSRSWWRTPAVVARFLQSRSLGIHPWGRLASSFPAGPPSSRGRACYSQDSFSRERPPHSLQVVRGFLNAKKPDGVLPKKKKEHLPFFKYLHRQFRYMTACGTYDTRAESSSFAACRDLREEITYRKYFDKKRHGLKTYIRSIQDTESAEQPACSLECRNNRVGKSCKSMQPELSVIHPHLPLRWIHTTSLQRPNPYLIQFLPDLKTTTKATNASTRSLITTKNIYGIYMEKRRKEEGYYEVMYPSWYYEHTKNSGTGVDRLETFIYLKV